LFDRPEFGNDCIVINIELHGSENYPDEFLELVNSTKANIVGNLSVNVKKPHPRYFLGSGKAEEIAETVRLTKAELAIVDHTLSPSQERNLESLLGCRVLDRSGLILDIFARRARSFEGKLQVELAQLQGIGLRGPGEMQLETDRRLIGVRIKQIKKRLQRVDQRREQGRRQRTKNELPTVSVVGYTNAGKSTLFNQLTDAAVYSADQLFATLDPTIRKLELGSNNHVVIADTVGFVSKLPHELVESFKSTLQETREAALLLHIIDAADPRREDRRDQVNQVLDEIGAKVPELLVLNKIDLLSEPEREKLREEFLGSEVVLVSATTGEGVGELRGSISERVSPQRRVGWLTLGPQQGKERALLYERDAVKQEQIGSSGEFILQLEIAEHDWHRFIKQTGFNGDLVIPPV